jgi:hypothetical protein
MRRNKPTIFSTFTGGISLQGPSVRILEINLLSLVLLILVGVANLALVVVRD